jgi:hypothetical protein
MIREREREREGENLLIVITWGHREINSNSRMTLVSKLTSIGKSMKNNFGSCQSGYI